MATTFAGSIATALTLDSTQFQQALGNANTTLVKFGATTQTALGNQTAQAAQTATGAMAKLGGSFSVLQAAMGAVKGFLGTEFTQVLGSAARMFAESEQLNIRLQTAVENTGVAYEGQKARIDALIASGMRFGFTQSQVVSSFAMLVTQTGSVEEAIKRQQLAFDLARGTGLELATASLILGKITDDNTRVLQRYGIVVRQGASEEEVLAAVRAKVGGQAEKQVNTLAVEAARLQNTLHAAMEAVGGFFAANLRPVALLTIAFESFGDRLLMVGSAMGTMISASLNMGLTLSSLGAKLMTFLVVPLALVAAGVLVAVGAMKLLSNIPGLEGFGQEVDQIGFIVDHIGWGGLISELAGVHAAAPPAATATDEVSAALNTLKNSYQGVMDKMVGSGLPAAKTFEGIKKAMIDMGAKGADVQATLDNVRDVLFGTTGMTAQDAMKLLGVQQVEALHQAFNAESDKMQATRDSAVREQEATAQFWQDEAARRADFLEKMADKTRPVIETIDQLNKDLGPGFDQNRRRLQAQAAKERLDKDLADMQKKEDERIARLRPPSTPTLDKLAKEGKTIDDLDKDIAASKEKWDKVSVALMSIIDKMVTDLNDRIVAADELRLIARNERGLTAAGGGGAIRADRTGFAGMADAVVGAFEEAGKKKDELVQNLSDSIINFTIETLGQTFDFATTKVRQGTVMTSPVTSTRFE